MAGFMAFLSGRQRETTAPPSTAGRPPPLSAAAAQLGRSGYIPRGAAALQPAAAKAPTAPTSDRSQHQEVARRFRPRHAAPQRQHSGVMQHSYQHTVVHERRETAKAVERRARTTAGGCGTAATTAVSQQARTATGPSRANGISPAPRPEVSIAGPSPPKRPAPLARSRSGYVVAGAAASASSGGEGVACCIGTSSAPTEGEAEEDASTSVGDERPPSPHRPMLRDRPPAELAWLIRASEDSKSIWSLLAHGEGSETAEHTVRGHALLRASWLIDRWRADPERFRLPMPGEALPREATISVDEMRAVHARTAQLPLGVVLSSELPFIALSHFWRARTAPDPSGAAAALVANALEGAWQRFTRCGVHTPSDLGVYVDWLATRPDEGVGVGYGEKALEAINLWYAHLGTTVWLITEAAGRKQHGLIELRHAGYGQYVQTTLGRETAGVAP